MKKSYLMIAAAALTLASCTNDDIIESKPEQAIGFSGFINKSTKADATTDNIKRFYVVGFTNNTDENNRNFNKQVVNLDETVGSSTEGQFVYEPLQYWTPSTNYYFMAFASPSTIHTNPCLNFSWPKDIVTPASVDNYKGVGSAVLNNATAKGQEDWIFAVNARTTPAEINAAPEVVKFQFKHILSRVMFTFENQFGSNGYTMKITNVKLDNAHGTGTFTPENYDPANNATGWSNVQNSFTIDFEINPNYFGNTNFQSTNNVGYLIPTSNFQYTLSFDVDLQFNGTTQGHFIHSQVKLPLTTFIPGYSYNFKAILTPENIDPDTKLFPILFDVETIKGWENDNNNHDIVFPKKGE